MQVVVGVALLRDGRVLAARRAGPAAHAGGWEFPGGKVEPGEDPADAAVREIAEELGCGIRVTGWLDVGTAISADLVLRIATAELTVGEPVPTEHDAIRWLGAEQLRDVTWLEADRPAVAELTSKLS